jgi:nitrate reductase (cytochrome), electron transfer subunit
MKIHRVWVVLMAGAIFGLSGCGQTTKAPVAKVAINDASLGLEKTSVYDVPTPPVTQYSKADPGTNQLLGVSYHTAPPQVPHNIDDFVPVTRDNNMCAACHNTPDLIGGKLEKGQATPAPISHYVEKTKDLYMGRWNCIQCHRPQSDAALLVDSVFSPDKLN